MNYYLAIQNEPHGPYSIAQLEAMWKAGDITTETLFCTEDMTAWQKLEQLFHRPPAANQNGSTTAHDLKKLFGEFKGKAAPVQAWCQQHGHQIILSVATFAMLVVCVVQGIREKSFWSFLMPLQGLIPARVLTSQHFFGVFLACMTLTVIVIFLATAWRMRRAATTILFCAFLFLSAVLANERVNSANAIISLMERSRGQNAEASEPREIYRAMTTTYWLDVLAQRRQKDFDAFHAESGEALAVKINDLRFAWQGDQGLDYDSVTLTYTIFWKVGSQLGRTRLESVIRGNSCVSVRALESTAKTSVPLGFNVMSLIHQ